MGDINRDSVGEEASAFGQRAKGDVKEAAGAITGNRQREQAGAQFFYSSSKRFQGLRLKRL